MAGRGRGRGAGMSFNIESLGFGRGESLPGPLLQPPPVYPVLQMKPVPLLSGEEYEYLLALKQEYRGTMKESPYHMKTNNKKKDIARYSDKYSVGNQDSKTNWQPDWSRLPKELRPKKPRRISKMKAVIKPKIPATSAGKKIKDDDIIKTFEELEKKEENPGDEKEEEEEGAKEEEQLEEEEYYEDDDIEDNDYAQNYFDNGETFGLDEDDDLDEGPVY